MLTILSTLLFDLLPGHTMKPKEKEVGMEKSSSNCIDLNCSAGSFRDPFLNAPQSFPPRSIRVKTLNTPPLNLKPFSSCIGSYSIENFSTNIIIRSQIVIHYFQSKKKERQQFLFTTKFSSQRYCQISTSSPVYGILNNF